MTPAETMRRAAEVLREAAEAATPGPWETLMCSIAAEWKDAEEATVIQGVADTNFAADAEFIALTDPWFALLVADLLEATAIATEALGDRVVRVAETDSILGRGLTLAEHIVGRASDE